MSHHEAPARMVSVERLLIEFGREERLLKNVGDVQHSEWLRSVITRILRIASEGEASIDPSETSD